MGSAASIEAQADSAAAFEAAHAAQIDAVFAKYDADHSGTLDMVELETMLADMLRELNASSSTRLADDDIEMAARAVIGHFDRSGGGGARQALLMSEFRPFFVTALRDAEARVSLLARLARAKGSGELAARGGDLAASTARAFHLGDAVAGVVGGTEQVPHHGSTLADARAAAGLIRVGNLKAKPAAEDGDANMEAVHNWSEQIRAADLASAGADAETLAGGDPVAWLLGNLRHLADNPQDEQTPAGKRTLEAVKALLGTEQLVPAEDRGLRSSLCQPIPWFSDDMKSVCARRLDSIAVQGERDIYDRLRLRKGLGKVSCRCCVYGHTHIDTYTQTNTRKRTRKRTRSRSRSRSRTRTHTHSLTHPHKHRSGRPTGTTLSAWTTSVCSARSRWLST
jgi:hypothetical protein